MDYKNKNPQLGRRQVKQKTQDRAVYLLLKEPEEIPSQTFRKSRNCRNEVPERML